MSSVSAVSVHLYINGAPVDVGTLSKRKGMDFKTALLAFLKPSNKNQYLELDIDSNDEYGILRCTDEVDAECCIPPLTLSRLNKYTTISMTSYSEWMADERVTVLLSVL
jgi:hypothetical protein